MNVGTRGSPVSRHSAPYRLSLAPRPPDESASAQAAKGPDEKAENDAEDEGGGERKRNAPAATAPGEIAREAAQRKVEASEDNDKKTRDEESGGEREQEACEAGHRFLF